MPQPDSAESTTPSEYDVERIEKHLPSPATSFWNCRGQIDKIAAKMPRRSNIASRVLDEDEDGAYHVNMHRKRRHDLAKKRERESALMKMLTADQSEDNVGTGAVKVDWEMPAQSNPGFAKYWEWQTERVASAESAKNAKLSFEVASSQIGLFSRLPGELRNKIYRLALNEEYGTFTVCGRANQCSLGPCTHSRLPLAVPGLLSTCKQIRHEAMPVFLSENALKFDARTVRCRCTANFLRAIGPHARFIRLVILNILVWVTSGVSRGPPPMTHGGIRRQQHPLTIEIICPRMPGEKFDMQINTFMQAALAKETELLQKYMDELNERLETDRMEQLLLEFVWSDRLAELVWKAEQGRY